MVSYGTRRERKKVFLVHIRYHHPSCMHGAPLGLSVGGAGFTLASRLVPFNSAWKLRGGIISWRLSHTEVSWGHHAFGKASFHDIYKYFFFVLSHLVYS